MLSIQSVRVGCCCGLVATSFASDPTVRVSPTSRGDTKGTLRAVSGDKHFDATADRVYAGARVGRPQQWPGEVLLAKQIRQRLSEDQQNTELPVTGESKLTAVRNYVQDEIFTDK